MAAGIWSFEAALISFIVSSLIGSKLIPFLVKVKCGQTIKEIGPNWHKSKQNTPTMGGIMFIFGSLAAIAVTLVCYRMASDELLINKQKLAQVVCGFVMAFLYGLIGFADDFVSIKKKRNLGLNAKQKLVLQFAVAILYLVVLGYFGDDSTTLIPFYGKLDLGILYYIISAVVIVGMVNAVNLTDGIDGLCGSVTMFAASFFMVMAGVSGMQGMNIFCAAIAGGCLGFLVWNFNPAKVFMGDTGSLFLGGAVCAMAFAIDLPILLLPVGIIYLCEMFSVIIQVTYFKATGGKRFFKMTPIHHHFEMCKWSEIKIVLVFSAVTFVMGIVSLLLFLFGVVQ
ncbi:MAG: phospho-N-acetylmuramoyl-pentapeptide-transferase [Acutalibacteraceae bacterium]|nr:phospho-N-acetylmuramoyl-pentapeptide-transferase [Clostridia bacterium]MEE3449321.1 phospho-N-acetylmuramoyl-pentapeptide-transferase [Acutalibacteraceae bacterium]